MHCLPEVAAAEHGENDWYRDHVSTLVFLNSTGCDTNRSLSVHRSTEPRRAVLIYSSLSD